MQRTFSALTTTVELVVDDELGIGDLAAFLCAGYPDTTEPPAIAYHLRAGAMVAINRYEDPVADRADLVPLFELDLYQQVAERAAPGWLLHAAALEKGGRAYLFAGPSGAGKTSLTLALLARGWRLVTEEMVHVDRDLIVRGLARPIHAPGDGEQRRALPASWPQRSYPIRRDGGNILTIVAQPPLEVRATDPLPLAAITRIGHAPGQHARASHLSASAALTRLWPCSLRQDDDGLAAATSALARTPAYELSSGSVTAAADLADGM